MIQYIGEHLLPGQIGKFALTLSFCLTLLASIAYFFATQRRKTAEFKSWRIIGRAAFLLHGILILLTVGIILYLMGNHYYEYQYVQQHTNDELPMRYILAAFWEGQEGSFLLWISCHFLLGAFLVFRGNAWESPVISVLSLIQFILNSMVLGIYVGSAKIGSSPVLLLREVMDIPLFQKPDYVSLIKGNGLNPLLQNYWMTIHPPTLFMGFASTSIPFCFAIAALWLRKHTEWLKAVQPWALFSAAILGLGILMGAAWAYEALSFGGYWAWDPVENMSLVPWLILIAGIHTNLISNATGVSVRSTYLYYILSFILVLYSSFLTRSGILGESSVHAFTEMGLEWQLIILMSTFTLIGFVLYFIRQKSIPSPESEESVKSREFWMYIGTMVLVFSSILITFTTSIPVYNKIGKAFGFDWKLSPPVETVAHYNKYQLWIGVFIAILSSIAQYFRYRGTESKELQIKILKNSLIAIAISVALTFLFSLWISLYSWQYVVLTFAGIFAAISNTDYLVNFLKGNLKSATSVFSHFGFGIMLLGIIASGLNKQFISHNRFAQEGLMEGFTPEDYGKNIILIKNNPMPMSGYEVTYLGDTITGHDRHYKVHYQKLKEDGTHDKEQFTLYPNLIYDKDFTKVAAYNPSTKHYLHKDIFTLISALPQSEQSIEAARQLEDSLKYTTYTLGWKDTLQLKNAKIYFENYSLLPTHKEFKREKKDFGIGLQLVVESDGKKDVIHPSLVFRDDMVMQFAGESQNARLKVKLPDTLIEQLASIQQNVQFTKFNLKEGDSFQYEGSNYTFLGYDKNPSHPDYYSEPNDVRVGAIISKDNEKDSTQTLLPIFLIRENKSYNIPVIEATSGHFFRFVNIEPASQTIELQVGNITNQKPVTLTLAEGLPRTDFIVLQAIVFPGINLFWLGSLLMLFGLAIGAWQRKSKAATYTK